jgi:hypothetical protein
MFDFIPFACTRRKMRNSNIYPKATGQFLQFHFPKAGSVPIAAARTSRNQ